MKNFVIMSVVLLLGLPGMALAQNVQITTQLKNYRGPEAYVAIYLTDSSGHYQQTLWVAGYRSKYYRHLPGWSRGSRLQSSEYDGRTGASVLGGEVIKVNADIPDRFIDAGYQIRVDTAVEDQRSNRAEVVVPLSHGGSEKSVSGNGYIQSLTYSFSL
ncbi:DUF2271 domain-containing protein [Gynuella sp.]|uniref:DUF2271 domain-containing protein n=1 Tax=Gynuella sp. TaxID=2969146 RepID=UPI003D0D0864